MFERYTEKARRVIFFARYEASQFGAPAIEPEHLLLGLMREDKTLTGRFFPRAQITIESIRREIEGRTLLRERIPTSVELPLALPVIFAGVRTAVVLNISSATLATFIGGGGLGDILDAGINSNLGRVTLVGAVLVSSLAMFVDWVASLIEAELETRT